MTGTQLGFDVEARAQILDRVLEHTDDVWRETALRAIAQLAGTGRVFQATDLLALGVTEPAHANHWGALFRSASQHGLIEHVGYAPSARGTVQGSVTKTWRGADAPLHPTADRLTDLRALSVHRPFANLLAAGIKPVENRTWSTRYRGLLVIHASQKTYRFEEDNPLLTDQVRAQLVTGVAHPTGFVGVAELYDICRAAVEFDDCSCGPWALSGHYHWRLRNPTFLPRPLPAKGRQGLFIPPLAVADMARRIHTHPEGLAS